MPEHTLTTVGRVCLVPDLDTELTSALEQIEELLLHIACWIEDDPDEAVPSPIGDGTALAALRRISRAPCLPHGCPRRGWRDGATGRPLRAMRDACRRFLDRVGATEDSLDQGDRGRRLYRHSHLRMHDYFFGQALASCARRSVSRSR